MISLKKLLSINRNGDVPIYLQVNNGVIQLIRQGVLKAGSRMPGSRDLAEQLEVHRKTIVAAYDELHSQGWIEISPSRGTFISEQLPEVKLQGSPGGEGVVDKARFDFDPFEDLQRDSPLLPNGLILDEGIPDVRIAPVQEILRNYRGFISRSHNVKHLSYGSFFGDDALRDALVDYLQETRGLNCSVDQILITRGSQMAMFLASQLIHKNGGYAVVGETNYVAANLTLRHAGAKILTVGVDDEGLITGDIEALCQKFNVKSVYVTSHHHHPTTVTMTAKRRLKLLELAEKYGFAILEDDYDFDFHYQRAPMLPLASLGSQGHVIYVGALCKIVAPAIRVGYMIGSKDFITAAGHFRRTIDRQGDALMERAIAQMIRQGDIQRHSRKALKLYHKRRDSFNALMKTHLSDYLTFQKPEGGMAFWVVLKKEYRWSKVRKACLEKGLPIPDYQNYDEHGLGHNGIRMGFASLNTEEQERVVLILKEVFESLKS